MTSNASLLLTIITFVSEALAKILSSHILNNSCQLTYAARTHTVSSSTIQAYKQQTVEML